MDPDRWRQLALDLFGTDDLDAIRDRLDRAPSADIRRARQERAVLFLALAAKRAQVEQSGGAG